MQDIRLLVSEVSHRTATYLALDKFGPPSPTAMADKRRRKAEVLSIKLRAPFLTKGSKQPLEKENMLSERLPFPKRQINA